MKTFYKIKPGLFYTAITLILISISISGSDCEKVLVNNGTVPSEMVGNWKLIQQTGALQDICPEENANFLSTGVAQLTCPNSSTISRDFTVENSVLTYTQTSVEYDVEFTNNNLNLILYGRNVSRNLNYEKLPAADLPVNEPKNSNLHNSSEAEY